MICNTNQIQGLKEAKIGQNYQVFGQFENQSSERTILYLIAICPVDEKEIQLMEETQ